ncbi:MAG: hypothetical protein Q8S05_08370, partial [Sulfuricella sp.]|nr:hypothetical protein [Sulfuricella sp.]
GFEFPDALALVKGFCILAAKRFNHGSIYLILRCTSSVKVSQGDSVRRVARGATFSCKIAIF